MMDSNHNLTHGDLQELVHDFLCSRDFDIGSRFTKDAAVLTPDTTVMGDLLEIYAGECGFSQDRATAAWDMATAVAVEGHPGGAEDDFDLEAAGRRLVRDWDERTNGEDRAWLHSFTSLRIAVGMYFTACIENRLRYELYLLACGIVARNRYLERFDLLGTRADFDEFFHSWWYRDAMTVDDE